MRNALTLTFLMLLLTACHGEKVPRDYQNNPPAMTHPVTSSSQTPTTNGMPGAAPETGTGGRGYAAPAKPVDPAAGATATIKDQAPSSPTPITPPANSTITTSTQVSTPPH